MRVILVITAALVAAAVVYLVPVVIDSEMLKWHVHSWLVRVLLADIPACGLLYGLGLRWSAILVYSLSAAAEGLALVLGLGPEPKLIMTINLVPAALSAAAALRIALRSAVEQEESL